MPPNASRFSCRRGALHKMTSKKARSRAPKAVSCNRPCARAHVSTTGTRIKAGDRWAFLSKRRLGRGPNIWPTVIYALTFIACSVFSLLIGNHFGSCWLSGGRRHHSLYQGGRDPFQIVATLKHRDVSSQKPFADATKEPHEIAAARPNTFHCVGVNFADAITIIIASPFALPWRMADTLVDTTSGCELPIG
jgi:hypothetical protein